MNYLLFLAPIVAPFVVLGLAIAFDEFRCWLRRRRRLNRVVQIGRGPWSKP